MQKRGESRFFGLLPSIIAAVLLIFALWLFIFSFVSQDNRSLTGLTIYGSQSSIGSCNFEGSKFKSPKGFISGYLSSLENSPEVLGFLEISTGTLPASLLDQPEDVRISSYALKTPEELELFYSEQPLTSLGAPANLLSCLLRDENVYSTDFSSSNLGKIVQGPFSDKFSNEAIKGSIGHYYNVMNMLRYGQGSIIINLVNLDVAINKLGGSTMVIPSLEISEENPLSIELMNLKTSTVDNIDHSKIQETIDSTVFLYEKTLPKIQSKVDSLVNAQRIACSDLYPESVTFSGDPLDPVNMPQQEEYNQALKNYNICSQPFIDQRREIENSLYGIKSLYPWTLGGTFTSTSGNARDKMLAQLEENRAALVSQFYEMQELTIAINTEETSYIDIQEDLDELLGKIVSFGRFDNSIDNDPLKNEFTRANYYLDISDLKMDYNNKVKEAFSESVNSGKSQAFLFGSYLLAGYVAGPYMAGSTWLSRSGMVAANVQKTFTVGRGIVGLAAIGSDVLFTSDSIITAVDTCTSTVFTSDIGDSNGNFSFLGPQVVDNYNNCLFVSLLAGIDTSLLTIDYVPESIWAKMTPRIKKFTEGSKYMDDVNRFRKLKELSDSLKNLDSQKKTSILILSLSDALKEKGLIEGTHFEIINNGNAIKLIPNNDNEFGLLAGRAERVIFNDMPGKIVVGWPPDVDSSEIDFINFNAKFVSNENTIYTGPIGILNPYGGFGLQGILLRHELLHQNLDLISHSAYSRILEEPLWATDFSPNIEKYLELGIDIHLPEQYHEFLSVQELETYTSQLFFENSKLSKFSLSHLTVSNIDNVDSQVINDLKRLMDLSDDNLNKVSLFIKDTIDRRNLATNELPSIASTGNFVSPWPSRRQIELNFPSSGQAHSISKVELRATSDDIVIVNYITPLGESSYLFKDLEAKNLISIYLDSQQNIVDSDALMELTDIFKRSLQENTNKLSYFLNADYTFFKGSLNRRQQIIYILNDLSGIESQIVNSPSSSNLRALRNQKEEKLELLSSKMQELRDYTASFAIAKRDGDLIEAWLNFPDLDSDGLPHSGTRILENIKILRDGTIKTARFMSITQAPYLGKNVRLASRVIAELNLIYVFSEDVKSTIEQGESYILTDEASSANYGSYKVHILPYNKFSYNQGENVYVAEKADPKGNQKYLLVFTRLVRGENGEDIQVIENVKIHRNSVDGSLNDWIELNTLLNYQDYMLETDYLEVEQ